MCAEIIPVDICIAPGKHNCVPVWMGVTYPCLMQVPECTDIEDSHSKRTVTFNVYLGLMVNALVFIGFVFIIVNIPVSMLGLNCIYVNQFHTKFTFLEGQWICS
jgi:hypothetical protein